MFTVRLLREEDVKSTLWAVLPLRVRVPVEVRAPLVLLMLPAMDSPVAPMLNVPAVRVRLPGSEVN